MADVTLTVEQIAESQLLAALRMWSERDYVPAITLAGAAEEVLGKRLRQKKLVPAMDGLRDQVVELAQRLGDKDPRSSKLVADLMNQTKNELKHYAGDEALSFDLHEDAAEMIERAIYNFSLLTGAVLAEFIDFYGDRDGD